MYPCIPSGIPLTVLIRKFMITLQNVTEIQAIYETQFNVLSERFFKEEAWPPAEVVAPIVKNDVCLCTKEKMFR